MDYLTLPGKSSTTEIRELERVTSKLRISTAASEDGGSYTCQASNAYGVSNFRLQVTIWGEQIATQLMFPLHYIPLSKVTSTIVRNL